MAKLTKSITFDTERDANVIRWATTQPEAFARVCRNALYAAMNASQKPDTKQQQPAIDIADLQHAIRTEIQTAFTGLALNQTVSTALKPATGQTLDADTKAKLLAF